MKVRTALVLAAAAAATAVPATQASADDETAPVLQQVSSGHCAPSSNAVIKAVPWGQTQVGLRSVADLADGGGVTVAVISTGVAASATGLGGAVLAGVDTSADQGKSGDTDCPGHGTAAAGIIAARKRDGAGLSGVAPGAKIYPVKAVSAKAQLTPQALAAGVHAAVGAGAKVILIPVGLAEDSAALRTEVDAAVARDVVIVAGIGDRARSYPAAYAEVVAVASVGVTGVPELAQPGDRVDIAAPGEKVVGLAASGGGNVIASGPGFAAAFVAGVAALVRSYLPELSQADVRRRLLATADRTGVVQPDPAVGYGIVDAYAAVAEQLPQGAGVSRTPVAPARLTMPDPVPPPDRRSDRLALIVAGVVVLGLVLGGVMVRLARTPR